MGAQGQRRQRGRTHKERWHFPEAGTCGSSAPRRPVDSGFVPGVRAGSSLVAGPRPQARGPWARRTHPGMVVGGAGARPRTSQRKHKGLGTASPPFLGGGVRRHEPQAQGLRGSRFPPTQLGCGWLWEPGVSSWKAAVLAATPDPARLLLRRQRPRQRLPPGAPGAGGDPCALASAAEHELGAQERLASVVCSQNLNSYF